MNCIHSPTQGASRLAARDRVAPVSAHSRNEFGDHVSVARLRCAPAHEPNCGKHLVERIDLVDLSAHLNVSTCKMSVKPLTILSDDFTACTVWANHKGIAEWTWTSDVHCVWFSLPLTRCCSLVHNFNHSYLQCPTFTTQGASWLAARVQVAHVHPPPALGCVKTKS